MGARERSWQRWLAPTGGGTDGTRSDRDAEARLRHGDRQGRQLAQEGRRFDRPGRGHRRDRDRQVDRRHGGHRRRDAGGDRPPDRRRGARRRGHRLPRRRLLGAPRRVAGMADQTSTTAPTGSAEGRHVVTQSPMRRAIARRMADSKRETPHFYVSTDVEMDRLLDLLDRLNTDRSRATRLTVTAFLIRAVAQTLAEHPHFNAVWNAGTLEEVGAINIGVAIALDDGLIAPALLDCGGRSVE